MHLCRKCIVAFVIGFWSKYDANTATDKTTWLIDNALLPSADGANDKAVIERAAKLATIQGAYLVAGSGCWAIPFGGQSGVGYPVKGKYLINTPEKQDRRCQVEHPCSCDPQKRSCSSGSDAPGCNDRNALKQKKHELATLDTTGGDPEDIFVDHA